MASNSGTAKAKGKESSKRETQSEGNLEKRSVQHHIGSTNCFSCDERRLQIEFLEAEVKKWKNKSKMSRKRLKRKKKPVGSQNDVVDDEIHTLEMALAEAQFKLEKLRRDFGFLFTDAESAIIGLKKHVAVLEADLENENDIIQARDLEILKLKELLNKANQSRKRPIHDLIVTDNEGAKKVMRTNKTKAQSL